MTRILVVAGFMAWIGLSLVLARLPFFQQPSLLRRLRPYTPGATNKRARIADARSFRDVVGPLSQSIGTRIAKVFGVHEEVRIRLERVHATETSSEFRVRQVAWSLGALIFVVGVSASIGVPVLFILLLLFGAPLLVFLMIEQQLANRSDRWQARLNLELPVVAEQMAMLLTAGFSLGGALGRLSSRTQGAVATDLRRVLVRVRQGIPESEALTEWATLAKVPSVDRLVAVLRLHNETSDLGRLVADEARVTREESHRELLEAVEKQDQMVWIPVTVAALVPGCIFLGIPFYNALSAFSS
jgi:tight adherence protein C